VDVTVTADFGVQTVEVTSVALDPVGSETHVIKLLDNLSLAEMQTAAFTFADTSPASGERWHLDWFALKHRGEQTR
jgi:hypothetical protein